MEGSGRLRNMLANIIENPPAVRKSDNDKLISWEGGGEYT